MGLIVQWDSIQRGFVVVKFDDKIPRYQPQLSKFIYFLSKKILFSSGESLGGSKGDSSFHASKIDQKFSRNSLGRYG